VWEMLLGRCSLGLHHGLMHRGLLQCWRRLLLTTRRVWGLLLGRCSLRLHHGLMQRGLWQGEMMTRLQLLLSPRLLRLKLRSQLLLVLLLEALLPSGIALCHLLLS